MDCAFAYVYISNSSLMNRSIYTFFMLSNICRCKCIYVRMYECFISFICYVVCNWILIDHNWFFVHVLLSLWIKVCPVWSLYILLSNRCMLIYKNNCLLLFSCCCLRFSTQFFQCHTMTTVFVRLSVSKWTLKWRVQFISDFH